MNKTENTVHKKTPSVTVLSNRGLAVRDIVYHRHPDTPDNTDERITRHQFDARGFLQQSADPRMKASGLSNFSYITSLSGQVLRTESTDAGTSLALNDAAGRPVMKVSQIRTDNGKDDRSCAVTQTFQYEGADSAGRPLSTTEQIAGQRAQVTERFMYAGNSDAEKALNLAGQCVSHYDTAGLVQTDSVALTGVPLSVTRRLLKDADNPDAVADWQGEDVSARNDLLATETFTTLTNHDATGAVLTTTDAEGNLQRVAYGVAGLLTGSWLVLKGGTEQVIVKSLTWSAAGQKLREVHGNGVVTTYTYEPQTQRLTGIKTERPAGHASGTKVLRDLRYEYDPVGNVLKINNDAEEPRFWRNQKTVPENTYTYDSLYQLVRATGREKAGAGQQGSHLPSAIVPFPTDDTAYTNYTRTYTYDSAGNLAQIRHSPAAGSGYTTRITVSNRSNRGVLSSLTDNAAEVDALFTAGGQQKQLQPGQNLTWTPRNELLKVTPVVRDGTTDDSESYRYDAGSRRVLKIGTQNTANSMHTQRVLYLPGLELRTESSGDKETERLQVISVGEAGRAQIRVLHWDSGKPEGIGNDQLRWSYDNLIGSSNLELDGDGNIISREEYYPYGGTAVWTARSVAEANYKTVRYSGKERDATGLYYYGYRYYQPWAGRWLSADPAGTVDGLNLFQMVKGNPVSYIDDNGLMFKILNLSRSGRGTRVSPGDASSASGGAGSASESDSQSGLSVSKSKNELVVNIIERLTGIVETGRGGMRTLQGEQFDETMTKLAALYIDLQPEGALSGGNKIMKKSKGFRRPPKDLVNQKNERGNLYDFMTPYLTRGVDSENFCLQNVTSDIHKWTVHIIDKQQKRLPAGNAEELLMRMNNAADPEITRAEFTKNPASRPPEDQEEAIQYIYYMAGKFGSESDWENYARDMYTDEYPQLRKVTYDRAKRIFDKNKASLVYES